MLKWDELYQCAFKETKKYLMNPLVLVSPIIRRPRILYTPTHDESLKSFLTHIKDVGKENTLHHLS